MAHPNISPAEAKQERLVVCALPEWLALWLDEELRMQIPVFREAAARPYPVAVEPALTGSDAPARPTTRVEKMGETAERFRFLRELLAAGQAEAQRRVTNDLVGMELGDRIIGLGERLGREMRHPTFETLSYEWRVRLRNLLTEIAGLGLAAHQERRGAILQFPRRPAAVIAPAERP